MKNIIGFTAAFLLFASFSFADTVAYAPIVPKSPVSMAMGGVFSSIPTSEFNFFGNPAAFASKKATLVLSSVDTWAYIKPTTANIGSLIDNAGDTNALLAKALGLMAENGGTGGGASVGLGYGGKGLGLGFFATTDDYVEGSSPAGAVIHSETEVTGIIGLGFHLQLWGLNLSIGGDLRPFYRVRLHNEGQSTIVLADMLSGSTDIYSDSFFGAAMDLGATMQLGTFTMGVSVRDIAPSFPIATTTVQELGTTLSSGNLPSVSSSTDSAALTPYVSAGVSWAPKLLPRFVQPTLYFEMQDPVTVIKQWQGIESALNFIHVGAEVKLLNFISLRAGLNRGWLSAGAGVKLLFLDVNAAVFTEELGALPGDQARSGIALQAAIRF